MKRIKLLTLSCLMSLSLPSFAQFSPDHKVSLDKGDIKSFIGDKESKGERKSKLANHNFIDSGSCNRYFSSLSYSCDCI